MCWTKGDVKMASGSDGFSEQGFWKGDTFSDVQVAPCFSNRSVSVREMCLNRLNRLQSLHQLTGIDLCDCVDFFYRFYLLKPNNLAELWTPQSCLWSVYCFRWGFEKTFSRPLHHESVVAALGGNRKCHRVFLQIYWECLKCCHVVHYWGEK